ncbi:hypothetical protein HYZ06_02325 [Candidatus Daviesbacteria bacterium]|nr:hypothetical protein [Candidatus Daviesbacteria bacterium]
MKPKALKRLRVEKDVIARVHRSLKARGQLNVSAGQEVSPDDIVGSCEVSPGFRTFNLSKSLSVSPKEVKKYLKREVGQKIYKGELLAYKNQSFFGGKKIVISPSDGILEFFNELTGELRLNFLPKKVDLPAAVYGVVEEVDPARGDMIIATQISRIYGMFGTGRSRDGILNFVGSRDEMIGESKIFATDSDQILVGGSLIYKEAISKAISSGVSGIITGGINSKDYKGMVGGRLIFPKKLETDIGISVIVCEGFGPAPLGEDIYEVLQKYNGKFALLDGNHAIINLPSFESSSMTRVRNTKLPRLQDSLTLTEDRRTKETEVGLGSKIRVVGNSFASEQGKVVAIDKTETQLPSGIYACLLTVETKRRKIKIPGANVELI